MRDIRNQPDHVREMLAGLCTVAVVSLIGIVWFRSFQGNIYALLNDETSPVQEQFAATDKQSLFGSLGETVKGATQAVQALVGNQAVQVEGEGQPAAEHTYLLPVSSDR